MFINFNIYLFIINVWSLWTQLTVCHAPSHVLQTIGTNLNSSACVKKVVGVCVFVLLVVFYPTTFYIQGVHSILCFFEDFKIYSGLWPLSVSPRCQCVYTMAGQTPVLQPNWQSSEISQHFKEKHNILWTLCILWIERGTILLNGPQWYLKTKCAN